MVEHDVENVFDMNEMSEKIEVFKAECSFPNLEAPNKIQEIIESLSSHKFINQLTPETISEYSVLISNYALYLQQQRNRIQAAINLFEHNIKLIVGQELKNSDEYSFQAKDIYIRANHSVARKIQDKKIVCEIKLEFLRDVDSKLKVITDGLRNLYFQKIKRHD